jgi:GST-like protein
MADRWRLYGARGWGSTLAEASLAWVGAPFDFVDVEGFDRPGEARDRLIAINPLARVPTLVSPQREVLTESAAIVLHLADLHPEAALAPAAGDPLRPGFLDRLIWFVSVVYPTFTYRDYPERWAPDAVEQLTERVDEFRRTLWMQLEDEVGDGEWVLGDRPSALDFYVCIMSRWRPRRRWIAANCPKLHAIALRAEALPAIQPVMVRNFPA